MKVSLVSHIIAVAKLCNYDQVNRFKKYEIGGWWGILLSKEVMRYMKKKIRLNK